MYRQNKNDQWIGTLSYNFTKPISSNKGVAKTLKVALLLAKEEAAQLTRKEILTGIGVPKESAEKKGQYACLFTALNWNKVVVYDKTKRAYTKGERFKEFMQYTLSLLAENPSLKQKHKKEYLQVLKYSSNASHFIME